MIGIYPLAVANLVSQGSLVSRGDFVLKIKFNILWILLSRFFFQMMRINNFRGNLTDVSAYNTQLLVSSAPANMFSCSLSLYRRTFDCGFPCFYLPMNRGQVYRPNAILPAFLGCVVRMVSAMRTAITHRYRYPGLLHIMMCTISLA